MRNLQVFPSAGSIACIDSIAAKTLWRCVWATLVTALLFAGANGQPARMADALVRLPPVASGCSMLTLDRALRLAVASSLQVAACQQEMAAAECDRSALTAFHKPIASLAFDLSARSDVVSLRTSQLAPGSALPFLDNSTGFVGGSVVWPLYLPFIKPAESASKQATVLADLQRTRTIRELRWKAAQLFLNVLRCQSQVEYTEGQLAYLAKQHGDAVDKSRQGVLTRAEMLHAKSEWQRARNACASATVELRIARESLNRIIGMDLECGGPLAFVLPSLMPPELETVLPMLDLREDVRALAAIAAKFECEAESRLCENHPTVVAHTDVGYADNDLVTPRALASIGLACNWNLTDGGHRSHAASALRHKAQAAKMRMWEARQDAGIEIRASLHQWEIAVNRLQAANAELDYCHEKHRAMKDSADRGIATQTQVAASEHAVSSARHARNLAVVETVFADYQLRYVAGI